MVRYLYETRRWFALVGIIVWAVLSLISLALGWPHLFAAMGAFALTVSFVIFLTDRFRIGEERRYWDSLLETQQRLIWNYSKRLRRDDAAAPRALDDLELQIEESFETLLSAKAAEKSMDSYRMEMGFSILGTLQWGFGAMLVALLHG